MWGFYYELECVIPSNENWGVLEISLSGKNEHRWKMLQENEETGIPFTIVSEPLDEDEDCEDVG